MLRSHALIRTLHAVDETRELYDFAHRHACSCLVCLRHENVLNREIDRLPTKTDFWRENQKNDWSHLLTLLLALNVDSPLDGHPIRFHLIIRRFRRRCTECAQPDERVRDQDSFAKIGQADARDARRIFSRLRQSNTQSFGCRNSRRHQDKSNVNG